MGKKRDIVNAKECQFTSLEGIAEGNAETPPISLVRHIKLFIRRRLTPKQDRLLHQKVNGLINWFYRLIGKKTTVPQPVPVQQPIADIQREPLKIGDLVRVKSREEINATLNHLGQSKGCTFIVDIMAPYCNTNHRVFKVMERFVDERDLRVKRCKGLVLLEGVYCPGTTEFGRCDRSCHLFWREEWLEKIEE